MSVRASRASTLGIGVSNTANPRKALATESASLRSHILPPHLVDNWVSRLDNHKRLFVLGSLGVTPKRNQRNENVRAADGTKQTFASSPHVRYRG